MSYKDTNLSPHFKLSELLVNELNEPPLFILANLTKLAKALEEVRVLLGNKPIRITSGYRNNAHNRRVGGAYNSYHTKGLAADITVEGMTAAEVQKILKDWNGGLGSYTTWTHVDIGPKRRWKGP
jgi:uncharacterized protein YcbK (DUF882 family)